MTSEFTRTIIEKILQLDNDVIFTSMNIERKPDRRVEFKLDCVFKDSSELTFNDSKVENNELTRFKKELAKAKDEIRKLIEESEKNG